MCSQGGRQPHECVYIGDDLGTDILPCAQINMKGIWLNRREEASSLAPDITVITSLSQLQEVLKLL
ncbi:HAD family hydrolase [Paenibacillus foliorum]|uniref:HAD family hydrolase n=1 Tax=Paenibacillus foliorum TaxID=2654974 RepID=UPI001492A449|nr:HAD family hydrolase [Paenibacillus foliorum]